MDIDTLHYLLDQPQMALIFVKRFPSLSECKEAIKKKSPAFVDKHYSDQCIKVLKMIEEYWFPILVISIIAIGVLMGLELLYPLW